MLESPLRSHLRVLWAGLVSEGQEREEGGARLRGDPQKSGCLPVSEDSKDAADKREREVFNLQTSREEMMMTAGLTSPQGAEGPRGVVRKWISGAPLCTEMTKMEENGGIQLTAETQRVTLSQRIEAKAWIRALLIMCIDWQVDGNHRQSSSSLFTSTLVWPGQPQNQSTLRYRQQSWL
ncbi:Hypothetical predicted protein [Xyrichtys novacula]|uniref:Uncharacterized protein n=1 Tax=Xyrichtys novacula TaxID=13765 RepID=A0AAV1H9L2_XYRNO|nr:Hypothetical predicted protein [Xyrichtys novacula]